MMDYEDREDLEEGLPKWPFFFSALFIFRGLSDLHIFTFILLESWKYGKFWSAYFPQEWPVC